MAGTPTTHYSLPTVASTDVIDGASQITALATATDNALYQVASASGYTLQPATSTTLGGVKIGSGVNVDGEGTISVTIPEPYTLPDATTTTKGGVIVGSGLTVEAGKISVDTEAIASAVLAKLTQATTWGDIAAHGFTYKTE